LQQLDHTQEEWMLRHGAHCIVGDTSWHGATNPGGVCEERVQTAVAALECVRIGSIETAKSRYGNVHRPGRYRYHRNAPGQSSESSLRAGWGTCSHRKCPGTRGTRQR
jgi:hypothetical protein